MKELTKEDILEIRKNPNSIDWNELSFSVVLSEGFIREFQNIYEGLEEAFDIKRSLIRETSTKACFDGGISLSC